MKAAIASETRKLRELYPEIEPLDGGIDAHYRWYFYLEAYQRGSVNSILSACLEGNTTRDFVDGLEKLRKNFNIDQWILFGGGWG